jgi:uncharacterized protein YeaO (DUF488 family)
MLKLKRAYDPVSHTDGTRLLVERLWPRGISKAKLHVDVWLKDVSPSTELRKWFSHDPAKWSHFRTRYYRELDAHPQAWRPIVSAARRGTVTLVYSSRDERHNNAVALLDYVRAKMRAPSALPESVETERAARAIARGCAEPHAPEPGGTRRGEPGYWRRRPKTGCEVVEK